MAGGDVVEFRFQATSGNQKWAHLRTGGVHVGGAPFCRAPGRRDAHPATWGTIGRVSAELTELDVAEMQARLDAASPGPWTSYVEGRDHVAGDSFIRISEDDDQDDMYVSRADSDGLRPATVADQDFIAHARQDLPRLLAEVRRLRGWV